MNFLRLLPVILSAIILAAHFYRAGSLEIAIFSLFLPFLLFYKRSWVARIMQISLLLGALEWLRTLLVLVTERNAMGLPWVRTAAIIGGIALFTGGSAFLFSYNRALKERYGLTKSLL